jgi:hypothetical protein
MTDLQVILILVAIALGLRAYLELCVRVAG